MIKKIKTTPTGKNWEVHLQPGGRGCRRYKRLFETKQEAKRFEVDLLNKFNQSKEWNRDSYANSKDTRRLSELCTLWYELHGKNLKDAGRLLILQKMCERLGDPSFNNFDKKKFAAYRAKRLNSVTPNTVNHDHSYLNAVFEELIRLGELTSNPIKNIRKLKIQETELCFLSVEQIALLLLEAAQSLNSSLVTVIKICLSTGTRWSEAEQLKSTQVVNGALHLSQTKSGKNRTLPISVALEKEILARLPFTPCSQSFTNALKRAGIDTPKGQNTYYATLSLRNL